VEAFDSLELRGRSVNNRYSEVGADGEAKEIYSFAPEAVVLRQRAQTPPSRANLQRRASRTIEDQTKFNVPEQRVGETLEEASQSTQQVDEGLSRDHFVVRQYAHEPAAAIDVTRLQAQPSLYWNPLAVTDAEGVAKFQFYAGAGDATYRVRLDAHDANGRLGAAESTFEVGFPFQLAETFPAGMTAGDRYDAPVEVENSSNVEQSLEMNVLAGTPALQAAGEEKKLALKANENRRMYVPLHAGATAARGVVVGIEGNTLAANEWKFSERVEQRMDVTSGGYPVVQWQAGWLIGETDLAIEVPRNPQPGSLEVKLWLYPGLPADFEHAHAALGELPRNNWNTQLALAYVDRQSLGEQFAGARVVQSPDYGNSAYGGFGGGRGDAYGPAMPTDDSLKSYWSFQPELLNFRAEVLGQQSRAGGAAGRYSQGMQRSSGSYGMRGADISRGGGGAGAYGPAPRGGAQFGSYPGGATNAQQIAAPGFGVAGLAQTSPEVTATWELANQSAGAQGLGGVNLQAATEFARKLHEPTTTGVVANGLLASGDEAAGKELLDRLVTWQRADGRVESEPSDKAEAAQTAVSPSTSSPVANTAIAALAWFKLPEYHDAAKKSIDWLVTQRRGGGFGSADDTYLALRALEAHAANGYRVPTLGVATLSRGDETLGRLTYDSSAGRLITFEGFESQLAPGENRLTLSTTAPEPIPFAVEVRYNADQPQNDAALPVTLLTSMSADRAELSQLVKLRVDVTNTSATPQDYIVAELGLPAGLEPNVEQLSKLQSDRRFDHFEAKARTLIPYWRSLAPNETRTVEFDLNAVAPGQFTSPASTVYRLTSPEQRNWSAPMKIEVDRPAQ
jgi:hypothetical protein